MIKDSPAMAKNKIKKSLKAIIDPYPSKKEVDFLWSYFESKCAYCGIELLRKERKGHQDHIISSAVGGTNEVHNFVLSCSICNGDEKREKDWLTFLREKLTDNNIYNARKNKIESWRALCKGNQNDNKLNEEIDGIINQALSSFEESIAKIRALKLARGGIDNRKLATVAKSKIIR